MIAAICHSAAAVMTVILTCQCAAGIALLTPLPVGSVAIAVVVLYFANIIGVVVAQHPIALPGITAEQTGILASA